VAVGVGVAVGGGVGGTVGTGGGVWDAVGVTTLIGEGVGVRPDGALVTNGVRGMLARSGVGVGTVTGPKARKPSVMPMRPMVNTAAATTSVTRMGETEPEGDWFIR